ncbi:MAG: sugar kinase [Ignavibacteriae bacterium]|nr:sugar kinase [Ignavibacteriota bacterium]
MSTKVVTFGEIMLRLSTPGYERFVQAKQFDVNYGGGEANVAVSLANYGLDSYYVTRLPKNDLGDAAENELRRYGVHTQHIVRGGERLGIYFLETGASQRASKVVYDRSQSSIAEIAPGMVKWDAVLEGALWFHATGITPALSLSAAEATVEAVKAARSKGLTVSCDLNYRKKLWTRDQAEKTMTHVMQNVEVAIANEEDAEMVFGIKAGETDVHAGKLDVAKYQSVAEQLMKKFPSLKKVAITLRESLSASDNNWSAVLWDGSKFYQSRKYAIRVIDRVGGGDAFGGGLIYGLATGKSTQDSLEFAVAASCLKHTIPGDFNHVTAAEVEALIKEGGSGRVQR